MQRAGRFQRFSTACAVVLTAFLLAAADAQTQPTRFVGSISAIDGTTLTVKTDAGAIERFEVPSTAVLKRIEPGERDLRKAGPLDFRSLAVGDRVLVALAPGVPGAAAEAVRIIAIQKSDLAKMQEAEEAAWSRGVHGLVQSVDAATGTIVVNDRVGPVTKEVTVHTTSATVLKRYAPGSVRFDEAQPAPIAAVRPGDQLWARGTPSAGGSAFAADAIVSGSFRSIPGVVISVDTSASTLTVKDLAAKKRVTIGFGKDAQLRQLDSTVAARMAALLKRNSAGGENPAAGAWSGGAKAGLGGGHGFGPGPGSSGSPGVAPGGAGRGPMDFESILERAPRIQLSDLKKGDAVMIVAAEDASRLNAVKLLAGVEPLLTAPQAQNLLSGWSMSSGESEAAAP